MPTYASAQYPKPTSWDEFEDICLSSFKNRWKSPNLQRHGRQGQAQQGVDIYGSDNFMNPIGIQCKNTVRSISQTIIDREISEAEMFNPSLNSLYIATTADTDASLQAYVRQLSQSRARVGKFTVDIVFWDAIKHDLAADPQELGKHYPQFVPPRQGKTTASSSSHDRDVQTLNRLLSVIDIEATYSYLRYAPKYVEIIFLEHIDNILKITSTPIFHIYDSELMHHLENWLVQWHKLANSIQNTPEYYLLGNGSDTLSFNMPGDFIGDPVGQQRYDSIEEECRQFFHLQRIFCDFVRSHFAEVDLSQTSLVARTLY